MDVIAHVPFRFSRWDGERATFEGEAYGVDGADAASSRGFDDGSQVCVEGGAPFASATVRAIARHRTAGSGSGSSRTRLIHSTPLRAQRILLVIIGRRPTSAPASPSRGPGNGILRTETGRSFEVQNAGERPEFCSQTALRRCASLTDRNYESLCGPGNHVGLPGPHGGGRSPQEPVCGGQSFRIMPNLLQICFFGGPKRRLFALFIALEHSSLQCVSRS